MANFLAPVLASVKEQLRDSPAHPGNFYAQARSAKGVISMALAADDVIAARAAAAAYGGLVKRWRRWLIANLTFVALAGVETSRGNVRAWQQRIFGQAVASARLKDYSKPERSGGGRVGPIEIPQEIEEAVILFYRAYAEKIKDV
jgi:hypothetical protein